MKQNDYGGVNVHNNVYQPQIDEDDLEMGSNKSIYFNTQLRLGFIRKVYGILSAQLLLTMLMCIISCTSKDFARFQLQNPAIFWISFGVSLITLIALSCFRSVARTVPTNYVLLLLFTVCEGYMVSFICSTTNPRIVLMAASMTCAITLALTYYACTTKTDFTMMGGLLFVFSIVLLLFGIFLMFTQNKVLHIIYSCLGVLLYSVYLIYDTQLIVGDKSRQLEIDDYVIGSLMLYMDIIGLFLHILKLLKSLDS